LRSELKGYTFPSYHQDDDDVAEDLAADVEIHDSDQEQEEEALAGAQNM